jgi:hypothetical protein
VAYWTVVQLETSRTALAAGRRREVTNVSQDFRLANTLYFLAALASLSVLATSRFAWAMLSSKTPRARVQDAGETSATHRRY